MRRATLIALALLLGACATSRPVYETWDPWEGFNRRVFAFNDVVDRAVLRPVSDVYLKIVPAPARTAVSNFFDNLSYLNVVLNSFLQGKGAQGYSDLGRFIMNSTLGLGGKRISVAWQGYKLPVASIIRYPESLF